MGNYFNFGNFMKELLKDINLFAGDAQYEELSGGLTNTVIKVSTGAHSYVARISRRELDVLGINRDQEYQSTQIAAELGVGPQVRGYFPEKSTIVIDFIEGKTFNNEDLENYLQEIIQQCKVLHRGPKFPNDFDVFQVFRKYLEIASKNGYQLQPEFEEFLSYFDEVESKYRNNPVSLVPCHNDLLAANFIKDQEKIWIVDYEYAGNNDPAFEIGNMWVEAELEIDHLARIIELYYGESSSKYFARSWLMAMVGQYFWALYASIQQGVSKGDFDFESWGARRFENVKKNFGSDFYKEQLALI
jgi:thiamine kinase-like enzyme